MRLKTLEQIPAQDFAGLQINVLQKLRTGNMTYEQFDWFANISYEKREKLMGKAIKNIEYPKMKLTLSGIEVPEGTIDFLKHFTENKNVKYWMGDNFKKHLINPTAKMVSGIYAMSFDKHEFTETIYDKEIMEHFQISESAGLMTREEILWAIASLTSKQPKGEVGALLNNGYATIIGYMLCENGVVRAVDVRWDSDRAEWSCRCRDLGIWFAGVGVLSRNL